MSQLDFMPPVASGIHAYKPRDQEIKCLWHNNGSYLNAQECYHRNAGVMRDTLTRILENEREIHSLKIQKLKKKLISAETTLHEFICRLSDPHLVLLEIDLSACMIASDFLVCTTASGYIPLCYSLNIDKPRLPITIFPLAINRSSCLQTSLQVQVRFFSVRGLGLQDPLEEIWCAELDALRVGTIFNTIPGLGYAYIRTSMAHYESSARISTVPHITKIRSSQPISQIFRSCECSALRFRTHCWMFCGR